MAATIFDGIHDNVATKADLSLLHAEVVGMRSATTGVQAEIDLLAHKADVRSVSVEAARVRDEVTALRGAVQAMERHLNARIERVEYRLLTRLGDLVVRHDRDHPGRAALLAARARMTCSSVPDHRSIGLRSTMTIWPGSEPRQRHGQEPGAKQTPRG